MNTKQLVNFCRPQIKHMQGELHETIKGNIAHMSLLNKLWADLDEALHHLKELDDMLEIEQIRRQQMPLLAQATDDYYRQMARDDE
jgi:hypothetical protein